MTVLAAPPLEIYLLGLVDFDDAETLQRRLVYEYGERPGAGLILCEHPPTISVGRTGSRAHIGVDDDELRSWGIRVRWVNRGGGCVLHVPGQLVGHLIFPLDALGGGIGLNEYLERLNDVILRLLEEFGLESIARATPTGVFLGRERVATLGVAVRRWIAYYGFTVNVGPFLAPFGLLDEPGLGGRVLRQTSIEARRQRITPMSKVREALVRHIEEVFGLERHVVFTSHPLVRLKALPHVAVQSSF
jgi:lipoyl(octanoyl) transferase